MESLKFLLRTLALWAMSSIFLIYTVAGTIRAFAYQALSHQATNQIDVLSNYQAILITKLIIIAVGLVSAVAISCWMEKYKYTIRDPF